MKKAEIIPVYKKDDPLKKENYSPVSLLLYMSKIFERLIYKQINGYMCDKLSKYITGFRKCHGTQHSLLVMLEKWEKALDKRECLYHIHESFESLSFGFLENAFKLMCTYLKDRRQVVQINNNFSSYKKVQAGVPQ